MTRLVSVALVLSTLVGCSHRMATTPSAAVPPATEPPPEGMAKVDGEPAHAGRLDVAIVDAKGAPPERIHAILAPSLEALPRCAPGSGGKITLHVESQKGVLRVTLDPRATIEQTLRACVLQTLSNVDMGDEGSNANGVTLRPSGFTSLIAVSW
jgi:hypothetical protein